MNKKIKIITGIIIALIFIVFVEKYFGWSNIVASWNRLTPSAILISLAIIFFSYWLRSLRLYDYFKNDDRLNLPGTFRIMLLHNFFNNFIPMRAGEASFPILMQRYFAVPLAKSGPALVWFRILDLHTLCFIGFIMFGKYYIGASLTMLLALPVLFLPYFLQIFNQAILIILSRRNQDNSLVAFLMTMLRNFPSDMGQFYRSWFWTVINWLVKLSIFSWLLIQFIEIDYVSAWVGAIAGDLTSVLPVHGFAGAGTYEAGIVAALIPFKIDAASALSGAINLHLFLLGATILGAAVAILIPFNQKKQERNSR